MRSVRIFSHARDASSCGEAVMTGNFMMSSTRMAIVFFTVHAGVIL
jgi:hypothetical protein